MKKAKELTGEKLGREMGDREQWRVMESDEKRERKMGREREISARTFTPEQFLGKKEKKKKKKKILGTEELKNFKKKLKFQKIKILFDFIFFFSRR